MPPCREHRAKVPARNPKNVGKSTRSGGRVRKSSGDLGDTANRPFEVGFRRKLRNIAQESALSNIRRRSASEDGGPVVVKQFACLVRCLYQLPFCVVESVQNKASALQAMCRGSSADLAQRASLCSLPKLDERPFVLISHSPCRLRCTSAWPTDSRSPRRAFQPRSEVNQPRSCDPWRGRWLSARPSQESE